MHQELVNKAENPDGSTVPSIKALSSMKYHMKASSLPSKDAIHNVLSMGGQFLLSFTLFPTLALVFATKNALQLLKDSPYYFIDGTFDISECDLQLTTLMTVHKGIGVPTAFMLAKSKTTECYSHFLGVVQKNCDGRLEPIAVLGDFEQALQQAVNQVFPSSTWYSDFFHFMQVSIQSFLLRFSFTSHPPLPG